MAKLGILLACEHYPTVSSKAQEIDAQLRLWLNAYGTPITEIEVFETYQGALPRHAASCDAWIVSGVVLSAGRDEPERGYAIRQFLRAAASFGRPIYAIHHGEHLVHDALAPFCSKPPTTSPTPRSIQNPFRSFHSRSHLHRFNPSTRSVEALSKPAAICPRQMFGVMRRAA